jgi:ATP-dependent RNA helicase DHX29
MKEVDFAQFFFHCPIIRVPGRMFPVRQYYLEDVVTELNFVPQEEDFYRYLQVSKKKTIVGSTGYWEERVESFQEDESPYLAQYSDDVRSALKSMDPSIINYELLEKLILHIASGTFDDTAIKSSDSDANPSAILVFLPGMGEISKLYHRLHAHRKIIEALPLHSSLPSQQQYKVFQPAGHGKRKVVLSTNIAETGVTIPDIVYVIDSGKAKVTSYDEKKHVTRLRESFIAKANSHQRQGRAGRVRPGYYFACFSRYRYENLVCIRAT